MEDQEEREGDRQVEEERRKKKSYSKQQCKEIKLHNQAVPTGRTDNIPLALLP